MEQLRYVDLEISLIEEGEETNDIKHTKFATIPYSINKSDYFDFIDRCSQSIEEIKKTVDRFNESAPTIGAGRVTICGVRFTFHREDGSVIDEVNVSPNGTLEMRDLVLAYTTK